jgi:glycolate oxidase FAD binding subunit
MGTTRTSVSLGDLRGVVGEGYVREAAPEDAVEGVAPSFVVEPGTIEELGELMKLASWEGLKVAPRGGGTKMWLGNPPTELDLVVSIARMNEVIEHVPGDQVVRVQAGIKLEDLQERLAASNQMLAVDPSEEGATIGGIVAANAYGPRRLRYATVRDLIIGITVVLSDGTVAKAGGKVVKNVAGYDLSKLFTGSLGTLGIIADATFRLHPIPETSGTVTMEVESSQVAGEAVQSILHSQILSSALELRWDGGSGTLAVLIENLEPAVAAQVETASSLLRSYREPRVLDSVEGNELIDSMRHLLDDDEVNLKIGFMPAGLPDVITAVLAAAERRGATARITGHAGNGVTFVGVSGGGQDAHAGLIEELREVLVARGGSVVVQRGPAALKKRVDAWGPLGDRLVLTRRVKEKFDPGAVLNPGRFVGGI